LPEGYYTVKSDKLAEELVDAAPVIIDVRSTADWDKDGYIEGAINIPFNDFFASLNKFLSELPEGFYTVKSPDLNTELTGTPVPFIFDVRTADAFAAGHIDGAVNININEVPANLAQLPADKAAPIVVLCQSGHRGALVAMYLRMTGYTEVRNLAGGMNAWVTAELPVVK
jgi:rhodanese-related sulfurtransferase